VGFAPALPALISIVMTHDTNLIASLREHVKTKPNEILYRYIKDVTQEPLTLTYAEVDYQARAIAATLLQICKKGDRALMLYPSGLDFINAFLGCLYAGVIAVPAYPPRRNQKMARLKSIISDADVAIVLTTQKNALTAKALFRDDKMLCHLPWQESDGDNLLKPTTIDPTINAEDITSYRL